MVFLRKQKQKTNFHFICSMSMWDGYRSYKNELGKAFWLITTIIIFLLLPALSLFAPKLCATSKDLKFGVSRPRRWREVEHKERRESAEYFQD